MALFKHSSRVRLTESLAFDRVFRAGNNAPYEGMYRCTNCGLEIISKSGSPLPNLKQREHRAWCTSVQWQLLVSTSADAEALHGMGH